MFSVMNFEHVFVMCTGQDDNIGDVVLRRRLLDELRSYGRLHIFLGEAGSEFIAALQLSEGDKVYVNMEAWNASIRQAAKTSRILYVAKPGEIQVRPFQFKSFALMLPLYRLINKNGGHIVQMGIGARDFPTLLTKLLPVTFSYHSLLAWRDTESHARFGIGDLMPDWGFDDAGPSPVEPFEPVSRHLLAIALRGDRPYPGAIWQEAIRSFAKKGGLDIIVVTQVQRDSEFSRRMARDLGAELFDWTTETHLAQERHLRSLYRRAKMVVSDRLHVLILAFTEGAVPFCLMDRSESKVGRHFDAVGYENSSIDSTGLGVEDIVRLLEKAASRSSEVPVAHEAARAQLAKICGQLRTVVSANGR